MFNPRSGDHANSRCLGYYINAGLARLLVAIKHNESAGRACGIFVENPAALSCGTFRFCGYIPIPATVNPLARGGSAMGRGLVGHLVNDAERATLIYGRNMRRRLAVSIRWKREVPAGS